MAFFSDTQSNGASLSARVSAWWDGVKAETARRRVMRATYAELAALSDRELADLGMSRAEISRVAREAAYGV